MIEGVSLSPLKIIPTPGGNVLHALKSEDDCFLNFGEAYFSEVEFKKIKAWKRHTEMTLNIVVPIGKINFVFLDISRVKHEEHLFLDLTDVVKTFSEILARLPKHVL